MLSNAWVGLSVVLLGGAVFAETFDGGFARLEIDASGAVRSVAEKPSGRELVESGSPVMTAVLEDGRRGESVSFAPRGNGRYEVGFGGVTGAVTLAVTPFRGGWTFRVEKADVARLQALEFFRLRPVCRAYVGKRINGCSDDASAVVLRSYRFDGAYADPNHALTITYRTPVPFAGAAVGLAAGRREAIPEMMRAMTLVAGVPHSETGGGWSLSAEMNRISYLIADSAAVDTMDDLLEIAERTGVGRFHFRSFWDQYGWYGINTNKYPRGLADLCACARKAKDRGLMTSIHNLSGCVGRTTPWVPTELADGIRVCHRYTLAEPIPADGEIAEIRVNEKPAGDHGYNFATWSRGNTIRIGTELFQYSEISFEPPYAFRKISRACFGSKPATHAAGVNADYLWCFFGSFLAEPGTPLAKEIAARYARVYAAGDFDGIYNDGLDGYRRPGDCGKFLEDFYGACAATGKPPHYEDSMWTTPGWWIHSMVGSWDYALWSPRTFVDRHLACNLVDQRLSNFQQMTLGWWPVVVGMEPTFGYMREDVEYFGAKIVGHDCSFSLIPNYYRGHVQSYAMVAQQVVLGWYERLRVAGLFKPALVAAFREKDLDFRLAPDAEGAWRVRTTKVTRHHMVSPSDRAWTVTSPVDLPAALRVRALDAGEAWDGAGAMTVLAASMAPTLAVRSEKGVRASLSTDAGEHGATLRLTATNDAAEPNGAWAVAERTIPRPFLNLWPQGGQVPLALGVWVKGDGSGADVNLQFHSPADVNNARSEHHLTLDFTGWRYFVFSMWRDHQPEVSERYRWPYLAGAAYNIYERSLACRSVEHVSLWMNGVEKGRTATVEISDLRVMRETHPTLTGASVELNGVRHEVPFPIPGGQYAELEDGFWTLYSLGGKPCRREKAATEPRLVTGDNAARFVCADASARAQVTVTALGPKEAATVDDWTPQARKALSVESDFPRFYSPACQLAELAPLVVRKGARAKVAYTLIGPASSPSVIIGDRTVALGRDLGANELVRGEVEGVFEGSSPVRMTCADAAKTSATLMLVKRYCP